MDKDDSSKKKPQRTIQVKIGGQAAKTMTPDQAAEYLKSIAGKHAFGREVKMTFNSGGVGSSSNNNSSGASSISSTSRSYRHHHHHHHHHRMMSSATSVAAEEMAAAAAAKQHNRSSSSNNNNNNGGRKDGMPCSEKEMKALMSMFVEIMGLQMNTDKLNKPVLGKKRTGLFSFPPDLPPPPGGWPEDLMWPKDGDDEDEDSLPDLEDVVRSSRDEEILTNGTTSSNNNHHSNATTTTTTTTTIALFCDEPTVDPEPVTGMDGIAAFEWEALERVAIEDALEQEERARKAAKKRDAKSSYKQQKKKEQARKEAQAKAAEVFAKKREKAIQTWKSRVIQAVQSNQGSLKQVLAESPFKEDESRDVVKPHLDELVQTCVVPKNRKSLAVGKGAREELAIYIQMLSPESLLDPAVLRNGRSVLQTCCFYADISMMNLIMSGKQFSDFAQEELRLTCHDSGWTPLHYASLSGSLEAVELLLAHGCDLKKTTNDTHTWRTSNGKGLTARQLVECILAGKQDQDIETHGMALEELTKDFQLSNNSSSAERRRYLALLEVVGERLKEVEASGYSALTKEEITKKEKLAQKSFSHQDSTASDTTVKKGKKKKKKAAVGEDGTEETNKSETAAEASTASNESQVEENPASGSTSLAATSSKESSKLPDDPLVTALLGMGFEEKQIIDGINACGGINRATADDVVAWIFGGGQDSANTAEEEQFELVSDNGTIEEDRKLAAKETKRRQSHNAKSAAAKTNNRQEAAKRAEEERVAAERLAAKREEQRRRNREWNKRQEAQAKAGNAARPGGGLPLAPPNVATTKNSPRDLSVSPSPRGSQQFAPDRSIPYEFVPATDASTVASSIDDDATISTLGSLQARGTPVMGQLPNPPKMAQQVAPPGFGQTSVSPREIPSRPSVESRGSSSRVYSAPASVMPPPGIPETRPLVEQSLPSSSVFASNTLGGGLQPRLATAQDTLPNSVIGGYGMGVPLAPGSAVPSSNANIAGSSHLFGTGAAPTPGYGDVHLTSLEGTSPVPSSTGSSVSGPPIPCTGPIGPFGLSKSQKTNSQHLDSSIIDSISTGNTVLAGATLWGDTMAAGTGSSGGTSLLGSLLQTGSALEHLPTTTSSNPFATNTSQDNDSSRTPGWGSSSQATDFQRSGSGSGSIW